MTLDKNELKYRAGLTAVDTHIGKLKIIIPLVILGWPIVLSFGGFGAVMGITVLGFGMIATAYKKSFDDWEKIDNDDRKTLHRLTPKKYRRDLHQAFTPPQNPVDVNAGDECDRNPNPNPNPNPAPAPPVLKLRAESHLLLMGATRSGKTTALSGLIPSACDVVYVSIKPDSIPVGWRGYQIDPSNATNAINQVLDTIEPLAAAMIRGDRNGHLWIVIDEILGICELCEKSTAARLLSLIKIIVTSGAGMGCFTALLMQSPNASDLGISAAIMRNFQAVVLASEKSGFDYLGVWSEKFCPLSPAAKSTIAALDSGFWAVSGGAVLKPAQSLTKTKKISTQHPSPSSSSSSSSSSESLSPVASPAPSPSSSSSSSCPECGCADVVKNGAGRLKCKSCGKSFAAESSPASSPASSPINNWGV